MSEALFKDCQWLKQLTTYNMFPFNRFTVCLLRVPTPLLAKAANNLQYVPFQQIHRLFASRANPIARYARMVGTSAYGHGACVAFSLKIAFSCVKIALMEIL